jgi:hypothetical protein
MLDPEARDESYDREGVNRRIAGVHRLQASYQLTKIRRDGVSLTSFESVHPRRWETAVPTGGNQGRPNGPPQRQPCRSIVVTPRPVRCAC